MVLGFAVGFAAFWAILLVAGALMWGANRPTHYPVPNEQARVEQHRVEVGAQAYREEQRRQEYTAP